MKLRLILIPAFFAAILLLSAHEAEGQSGSESRVLRTVVIDPGHGGNDPGAVAGGIREKDLVLAVGLRLGEKIKKAYPGVKVIYTRSKDVFIPLHVRASIAVRNKADLFISLHANWVTETYVRGTETFTLGLHRSVENLEVAKKENAVILLEEDYTANYEGFNPNETESYIMFENMQAEYQTQSIGLAANIQNQFTRNLKLVNRGVKQAGFLVLRQTSMPGVLVEIGFISNPTERKFLVSEEGKAKVTESIFQAFAAYKKEIDNKSRFNLKASDEVAAIPAEEPADTLAETPPAKPADTLSSPVAEEIPAPQSVKKSKPEPDSISVKEKQATPGAGKTAKPEAKTASKTSGEGVTRWYSVQVGAVGNAAEPSPANFKGEKNIYRLRVAPLYKFYSGKFFTKEEALAEKNRLVQKFPQAFIVEIENGIPRPLQKSELP